jgi:hypothetical protein
MVLSWGIIFVFTLRMGLLEIQFENWSVNGYKTRVQLGPMRDPVLVVVMVVNRC